MLIYNFLRFEAGLLSTLSSDEDQQIEGPEQDVERRSGQKLLDPSMVADPLQQISGHLGVEKTDENNLAGHAEGSDTLPARFTDEPSDQPGSEGHVCELELMLEEYYEKRGWVNGVVPEAKLKELEII